MSDHTEDLALLETAARAAGDILRNGFGRRVETWSKGAAGPVTEIDLAADKLLKETLTGARPDYGWLSEETTDNPERLGKRRVFIVDPLDGTIAFIKGEPDFVTALAIVEDGEPIAAALYAPITDEMFLAARGAGAFLNGAPIAVTSRTALEEARIIASKAVIASPQWPQPWPPLRLAQCNSVAYRLATVARGKVDGLLAFGYKNEWDTVGGALIVAEAGGVVSDPWGKPLRFNQPDPRAPGAVAGGATLHALLIERTQAIPHPAAFA